MAITTLSRFSLTSLRTLLEQALSTSEQAIVFHLANTGDAVTAGPFMTLALQRTQTQGSPGRIQTDNLTEEIHQHCLGQCVVQAFGNGAFSQLSRLNAWTASSAGIEAFRSIDAVCMQVGDIQDTSAAVSSGYEERATLVLTLGWKDIYQIEQLTISEVPISVLVDTPAVQIDIVVTK
ncbi:hypothetical protein MUU49_17490 [Scandinavium goeteborgense]|uniref:phage neck terminator protein n=1 Tax=Scandinavium goeteborgense TaxID=1851514 RepID=UPI00216595D2|nr:hypothetical protein [Scandinavium goeteborgense]MCS2154352.1 hypothetical protein [Scandinavium goeteborgense]